MIKRGHADGLSFDIPIKNIPVVTGLIAIAGTPDASMNPNWATQPQPNPAQTTSPGHPTLGESGQFELNGRILVGPRNPKGVNPPRVQSAAGLFPSAGITDKYGSFFIGKSSPAGHGVTRPARGWIIDLVDVVAAGEYADRSHTTTGGSTRLTVLRRLFLFASRPMNLGVSALLNGSWLVSDN
jgi:hypothetical protein